MTTLFSKGIELEQSLRSKLGHAQLQVRKELESRGLNLSAADLAALIEEVAPTASRVALSGALDFLRPFTAGLGLRVARLSDTQLELVIPARERNLGSDGHLHEGVLIGAGIEAAKLLWSRHAPLGVFEADVRSLSFEMHRSTAKTVRVRLELQETSRENTLAILRKEREATSDLSLRYLDDDEQSVADLGLSLKLRHTPTLQNRPE